MSLFFLLNPKQYGSLDTSDVLRRQKREEQALEERIAAQILQSRQQDIIVPPKAKIGDIIDALRAKALDKPLAGELVGKQRQDRVNLFILALLMDE